MDESVLRWIATAGVCALVLAGMVPLLALWSYGKCTRKGDRTEWRPFLWAGLFLCMIWVALGLSFGWIMGVSWARGILLGLCFGHTSGPLPYIVSVIVWSLVLWSPWLSTFWRTVPRKRSVIEQCVVLAIMAIAGSPLTWGF
jgi:hypothetical protein